MQRPSPLKIFFDSDVIIAGSFSKTGASQILLQLAEVGVLRGYISEQVVEECTGNIRKHLPSALPVFKYIPDASFLKVIIPSGKFLEKAQGQADDKDIPILAAALQAQVDILVTFNIKDYFPTVSPPKILKPGELLKTIQMRL